MASTIQIKKNVSEYNPYMSMDEEEILAKLKTSRDHTKQEKCRNADDVISDMRKKYGLTGAAFRLPQL